MSRLVRVIQRLVRVLGDRQQARWDRFGEPRPVPRWCFRHPWTVTVSVAAVLAVVLGATFGVPPFSPLLLVVVLVAPIQPILGAQQRAYERWRSREPGDRP